MIDKSYYICFLRYFNLISDFILFLLYFIFEFNRMFSGFSLALYMWESLWDDLIWLICEDVIGIHWVVMIWLALIGSNCAYIHRLLKLYSRNFICYSIISLISFPLRNNLLVISSFDQKTWISNYLPWKNLWSLHCEHTLLESLRHYRWETRLKYFGFDLMRDVNNSNKS